MNTCPKCGSARIAGPTYKRDMWGAEFLVYACLTCHYSRPEPIMAEPSTPAEQIEGTQEQPCRARSGPPTESSGRPAAPAGPRLRCPRCGTELVFEHGAPYHFSSTLAEQSTQQTGLVSGVP